MDRRAGRVDKPVRGERAHRWSSRLRSADVQVARRAGGRADVARARESADGAGMHATRCAGEWVDGSVYVC